MPELKIKRLYPEARLPVRATPDSIGLDLYAHLMTENGRPNNVLIPPRSVRLVHTGLLVVPPPGYACFVCSRSGMARNLSVWVANQPGVIDPDYRGELGVLLYNGGLDSHYIRHGDRAGQLILLPCVATDIIEIDQVDSTARGVDGFGSTGR
jgi:dUTP pyrophosphatase